MAAATAAEPPRAPGVGGFGGFGAGSLGGMGNMGGLGTGGSLGAQPESHGDWIIAPSMLFRQFYTDNVSLASRKRDDAFISELSPSISIAHSGKSEFRLNYRMQNLFYAATDINPRINHQLQMTSHAELIDNSVFVNATSTIGQYVNPATGILALDQTSAGRGSSIDYQTFRVSPYWLPRLGGYAEGIVLASYGHIGGGSGGSGIGANIFEQFVDLHSGKEFETLRWRTNFYNQDNQRDDAGTIVSRNYNGELSYSVLETLRPFVQLGNFENEVPDGENSKAARSGAYWTAGLYWNPGKKLAVQAGYGDRNSFASLSWAPSQRTQVLFTYRDSRVGTFAGVGTGGSGGASIGNLAATEVSGLSGGAGGNASAPSGTGGTGSGPVGSNYGAANGGLGMMGAGVGQLGGFFAGQTWNAALIHRTRRTTWSALYTVQTTAIQQVLLNQPTFGAGAGSNPLLNAIDQPCLTNDPITRKRAQVGMSAALAKSSMSISGYQEDRSSRSCGSQDIWGVNANLGWRFMSRTSSFLSFAWQSVDSKVESNANGDRDILFVSVGMSRAFSPDVEGFLEFRHTEQTAARRENEYEENRLNASVFMRF